MLTESEIASMQDMMLLVMPDRASILRKVDVKTGLNVSSEWAIHATDVPCRVFEPTGIRSFEGESAGKQASAAYPVIRVPPTTDVHENDVVLVGSRRFEITRVVRNTYGFVASLLTTETR